MKTSALSKVCEVITRGISPKYTDDIALGVTVLNQKCIRNNKISLEYSKLHDLSQKSVQQVKFVKVGDILVNSTGHGTLGRTALVDAVDGTVLTDSHITIIRAKPGLFDSRYFAYLIGMCEEDFILMATGTSGQTELPRALLNEYKIQYEESLDEQRRVVAKLDAAFEKIDQAVELNNQATRNSTDILKAFLKSFFDVHPDNWSTDLLGNITKKIGSGSTPRGGQKSYQTEGVALVRSLNIYDLYFKYEKLAYLNDDQAKKLSNVTLENGDVLVNITGASIARCNIVPDSCLPGRVNQHVSIIRADRSKILPEFLHYELISEKYKEQLLGIGEGRGSTRQAITKGQLQNFRVYYPKSLDEQLELVEKINKFKAQCQYLKNKYEKKTQCLIALKLSMLHDVFSESAVK